MKNKICLSCFVVLLCAIHAQAQIYGDPIFNPDNGHYYETVLYGTSWTSASNTAASLTFGDAQGYLATISSQTENDFVYDSVYLTVFTNYPGITGQGDWVWLGGYQLDGSPEPAGGWTWVTDEPFDYTNWNASQPSDSQGGGIAQNYLLMWHGGYWNDAAGPPFGNSIQGFIVEFAPTPEPPSIALLALGGLLLCFRFIKKRPLTRPLW